MNFLIAGGGTGGHYFPAYALATCLLEAGHRVLYVGTENGIEKRLGFPAEKVILLKISGVVGRGISGLLSSFRFLTAGLEVAREIERFKPNASIVFGGYVSLPSGFSSYLKGIPLFVQEQNSIPGRVNRLLSRFSVCSFSGFPKAADYLSGRTLFTGNPVRREIVSAASKRENQRKKKLEKLGLSSRKKTLLVLGGSQGALWINKIFLKAASLLKEMGIQVIHVTGRSKEEEKLRELYGKLGIDARVFPFYKEIWELYSVADAAVSRAGALAISELSLFGIPTLFIPYPFAADNHQLENAKYLSSIGAALYREQSSLTPEELAEIVENLLFSIIEAERLRENFLSFSRPKATEEIAEVVCGKRDL